MNAFKRHLGLGSDGPSGSPIAQGTLAQPPALPSYHASAESSSVVAAPPDMRRKMVSLWHAMKYGKTIFQLTNEAGKSEFNGGSPVHLLGLKYQRGHLSSAGSHPEVGLGQVEKARRRCIEAFHLDFETRIWMTYRRNFESFPGSDVTSDCGWGCMLRSGQMLVANTLLLKHLGRHWRVKPTPQERVPGRPPPALSGIEAEKEAMHKALIRLFGDTPQVSTAPISIHNLMALAQKNFKRQPGDWFGPATTAYLLQEAVHQSSHPLLLDITIYVATDCTVFKGDVRDLCERRAQNRYNFNHEAQIKADTPEEFSILEHPLEYAGSCVSEAKSGNAQSQIFCGVVDGVPYFSDVPRNRNSDVMEAKDFQMLSDGTEHYALNQDVSIEGSQWVMEGPSQNAKHTESQPSKKVVDESARKWSLEDQDWNPVLLLIPVRIGTDKINPMYVATLKTFLTSEHSMGIIGGRPKHSLYFVGLQEDNLINLDPHLVQDSVNVFHRSFDPNSYHCKTPRKINIHKMDPSCCFAFYCETRDIFEHWCTTTKQMSVQSRTPYPMFGIEEGKAKDLIDDRSILLETEMMPEELEESTNEITEDFVFVYDGNEES
ncbi:cysteine protease ATG4D-like [Tigriopus californicus]|nr:cysteine protease ATG4D-like [Tigriopus californicus]|eukprot:TCALIF_01278-PA protein Name:"Similar to atg4c Cysteine protease ATG4C (Xenopus laevis)" AED:0.02 eAED:0.02 QI:117/1/1/1/1/1/3/220/600